MLSKDKIKDINDNANNSLYSFFPSIRWCANRIIKSPDNVAILLNNDFTKSKLPAELYGDNKIIVKILVSIIGPRKYLLEYIFNIELSTFFIDLIELS